MRGGARWFPFLAGLLLVIAAALPAVWGAAHSEGGYRFGGILINPLDGNSYLAKARQGWAGSWRFTLPYTAEPGEGAYFHLTYLFIGHTARVTGLSLPFAYNLFRVAGAVGMAAALWKFYGAHLSLETQRTAFAMATLGLGMGWLLLPSGTITSDFWIAEGFPFLAALANVHFPVGLAIIALLANPVSRFDGASRAARDALLAFLLGLISPFGVVIAVLPWAGTAAVEAAESLRARRFDLAALVRSDPVKRAAAILIGGGPIILYDLAAIAGDPVLAAWDAQNLTPSPPWWDLGLSFAPAWLLGLAGIRSAPRALKAWAIASLVLVFLPFGLQRRFMMGLLIPLAGLGAAGLQGMEPGRRRLAGILTAMALLPGPLLMLITVRAGIEARSPLLFLLPGEPEAYAWLQENAGEGDLVVAAPDSGMFLPAHAEVRVIYGHPFETIRAEEARAAVTEFYALGDPVKAQAFLTARGADFVLYGPRERELGALPSGLPLMLAFESRGVQVYRVLP